MVKTAFRIIAVPLAVALLLLSGTGCTANRKQTTGGESDAAASRSASSGAFATFDGGEEDSGNFIQRPQGSSQTIHHNVLVDGKVCVEIDTFLVFDLSVSPQVARDRTLSFIRELALQKALPVEITITSLITDMYVATNSSFDESTAKSIFMLSSSAGRFESEQILSENYRGDSSKPFYRMHYKAEIIQLSRSYNSAYNLRVELSETLLRDGERFRVSATANSDGYLYIFDFLPDNSVSLVFPTHLYPDNRVQSRDPWTQQFGAATLPGRDHSIETLYFVFSAQPISGWEDFCGTASAKEIALSGGEGSFIQFQKWLARSDPSQRVEKLAQLHILK